MYIKTITIQGFKSYRDQVAVDPFSPGHNVVVGRNGSGKSNFFSAIRFVLSDQYTKLSREERQRLLHEGTSTSTTLSAYVEIVFDNSDGRFPTGRQELVLRRTIGLKKDEYSLDRKSASKSEVDQLLESAGFSKANPYYIVPQGRITHLTNMNDRERLRLLKDVAGTEVYEQKRAESTRIMEETDGKRDKILELLTTIEDRLRELEEEKEELKEYQEKDRERRCLEYALHQRELEDVTNALDEIEAERRQDIHDSNEKRKEFNDREDEIQRYEEALTAAKHSLSTTQASLRQYETERADLVRNKTELECVIADFETAGQVGEHRRAELAEELEVMQQKVDEATARLEDLVQEAEQRIGEEKAAREALEPTQSKLSVLFAKQGRAQQFATQAARDEYLRDEIKALEEHEKNQGRRVEILQNEVAGAKEQLAQLSAKSEQQAQGENDRRENLKKMNEEIAQLQTNIAGMHEQKKELWREEGKLTQIEVNAKSEMEAAERSLMGMMNKDTSNGLRAVRQIAKRLNLDGVFGPLYDLFEVSDKYKTAVEVTAGNSLFHVVVDNDETASKLLDVMNREKSGRVTFMPLNRLKSHSVNYPKANDAIPMIQKLQFDREYVMAFEQVFGRTIICEDLQTAAHYTRSHGLNAVTIEGDRVDRKGALTGGYHDVRRSRLDTVKAAKKWRTAYETDHARHIEVKAALQNLEQEVTRAMGQVQALEAKKRHISDGGEGLFKLLTLPARDLDQARDRVTRLESSLEEAEGASRDAKAKRASYEEELRTPMRQNLTDEELRELETLTQSVESQKKLLFDATQSRAKAVGERNRLEIELSENLRRKRQELRDKLDRLEGEAGNGELQSGEVELRRNELRNLVRDIEQLEEKVSESEGRVDELNSEISKISENLERVQTQQMENTRAIMRVQKNAERYLTKRQTLINRREECNNAIRDLGALPEEAFSKYTDQRSDKIIKRLHKVNDGLKKFAHVNKKAFEQYNNFTKQRDELMDRRDELDQSAVKIEELIETLDQRKDEAIERTFKQVSKYFEEVFETLVPLGKGELIMQKKTDGFIEEESEESLEQGREKSDIDSYTGVSIRVSFNSKHDEGQRIQQLSGGQKSLVALALVFAIQKCDPAPFYLFDEIDANLDAQYRTAVATMIHTLSTSAQFITTTFKSEMLAQADKFYGVFFDKQKVSTIKVIEKEEASDFVETAAQVGQL
ncbi:chromosome associated protein [Cryptococcus neoformans C23]|uniref:Urease accessory protein 2 n=2 Tax=Cryptococcus neoformans TaxID=5207 RepID=URE2_CRYN9|nr:chromosome associated protein [Cryptococcus neoformans var. grubii H99]AUB24716.1 chromosome associated protein [Cryptococcus neoformans var. grubii]OWZ32432.1 chromosome associated protein [Cryptococcus neoformans var. grubii AD2-60a]OWZ44279.1 chromosome associated protein [Cryptococcus neoformans var. grubii C23]OWZ44561.1 chromosome associated protein [Cryptococcus neoformans var. grubii AD1-83a]OWZ57704.1 chromosome associated protein [Cryptococcus neoformans var. grubii 125.91]OXC849|eukprot:XP_012049033.1 chromosome associated protein [Cryptococcus neoformans var. grubii H99]